MLTRRDWGLGTTAMAAGLVAPWRNAAALPPSQANANTPMGAIAARYFTERMELDPLNASATLAAPQYEGRLAITIAPDEIAKGHALAERVAKELAALPASSLSAEDQLNHELLDWEVQQALEGDTYPDELMPLNQYGGLPVALANMAGGEQLQPLKTPGDYDNYLKRLQRVPEWCSQAIANMREGVARGYTVPRVLVTAGFPMLKSLIAPAIEKTPYAAALRVLPKSFSDSERNRITQAYRSAYAQQLRPALQKLLTYLQGPYLSACRSSAGLDALPDGAAWYAYLVRNHTTTRMTPEEIHALGLAEVARIQAEMAALQPRFGFKGGIGAFLRWHETQPRFCPYRSWEEILEGYEKINERVVPQLPRLFGHLPKQPLQIHLIPELQRATTSPYYNGASPDGTRPGIFFVGAPTTPPKYNNAMMTALLLHEGQPGHHFQYSTQQALTLPDFRRYGWHDAYGEGWALYAETLGHEMGLYEDPNQHLGQLKMELHRAVRLVTDTGLHAKGWSREKTMRYMVDAEGLTEADARQSTERYMADPGQALAYKIGALKIQQLRQRAQAGMGSRFSLAAFHDCVLGQGSLPLAVLDRQMDAWISVKV